MKAQAPYLPAPQSSPATSLSLLVLVSHWPLEKPYQEQLSVLMQAEDVRELILLSKQLPERLLPQLAKEPKLRYFQLSSGSFPLMAEAGAFEAAADVLVILKQDVSLPEQALQTIREAGVDGVHFGGLIRKRNRLLERVLEMVTVYCKGLFWFRFCQGYFVSRQVYHQSGGFKQNGRLLSFFELLCRQQKLSSYTFILF